MEYARRTSRSFSARFYVQQGTQQAEKSRFRVEINYKPPQRNHLLQNVIGMMLKVDSACELKFP